MKIRLSYRQFRFLHAVCHTIFAVYYDLTLNFNVNERNALVYYYCLLPVSHIDKSALNRFHCYRSFATVYNKLPDNLPQVLFPTGAKRADFFPFIVLCFQPRLYPSVCVMVKVI